MGDLTLNISRYEIACRDGCGYDTIDYEIVAQWQTACNFFVAKYRADRARLTLCSGCRCETHNRNEGGAERSGHLFGKGIDGIIDVLVSGRYKRVPTEELYEYFKNKYPKNSGVGQYPDGRVHKDCMSGKLRLWDRREK